MTHIIHICFILTMVASVLWLLVPIVAIFGTAFLCYGIRICCEVNGIGVNHVPEGPTEAFFVDLEEGEGGNPAPIRS